MTTDPMTIAGVRVRAVAINGIPFALAAKPARPDGGHGEFVDSAKELPGAIERALESGLPGCINVAIDPAVYSPMTQAMASFGLS